MLAPSGLSCKRRLALFRLTGNLDVDDAAGRGRGSTASGTRSAPGMTGRLFRDPFRIRMSVC
jgi:hypothetical protein